MSNLWQSKLNGGLHAQLHGMNQSLGIDARLWREDIQGSLAHLGMLRSQGLVNGGDAVVIEAALKEIMQAFEAGEISPGQTDEDIHGLVERLLVEKVGPVGSNIHIGRSRNEQIVLDVRLYLIKKAESLIDKLCAATERLRQLEVAAGDTYLPSYTHLQRAQPLFLKQYWLAHGVLWGRTKRKLEGYVAELKRESPMGSGAVNGSTLPLNPALEAELLGFENGPASSLAAVSARHDALEFCAIGVHWLLDVSRMMEDLILWSSQEFGFILWCSEVTTGSSMMPQKRNPDIAELIRGKTAVACGYYEGLLMLLKGLPMGYMKDLQEDKTLLFGVVDILDQCLDAMPLLLDGFKVQVESMQAAASDPRLLATDVLEVLVRQGMPLRVAHRTIADAFHEAGQQGVDFATYVRTKWPDMEPDLFDPAVSCRKRFK